MWSVEMKVVTGRPLSASPRGFVLSGLGSRDRRQCLARFHHGLQVAEDVGPSANAGGRLGRRVEAVMDEGQLGEASWLGLDLPGNPALRLGGQVGVVEAAPGVDEAAGWVAFQDDIVAPHLGTVR